MPTIITIPVKNGGLVLCPPFDPPLPDKCKMYVTPTVFETLHDRDPKFADRSLNPMRVVIDRYIAGRLGISVNLNGDEDAHADFKRLHGLDEVWAVCARRPKCGQTRLFGRFATRRAFVGLSVYSRDELADKDTYNRYAAQTIELWNTLFGTEIRPHSGATSEEYLDRKCLDV